MGVFTYADIPTYGSLSTWGLPPVASNTFSLVYQLNRLAATDDLAEAGAANALAGTSNLKTLGALNSLNSTADLGLRAVCNALAGTQDEDPGVALSQM